MKIKSKRREGIYFHFSLVIIAQDKWRDEDKEEIRKLLIEERTKKRDEDYPFIMKLVYRVEKPNYGDCQLCNQIYDFLLNKKANYQGIIYHGHHHVYFDDDLEDMINITKMLIENPKIKKLYILRLDSLSEFKTEAINKMSYEDLTNLLKSEKQTKSVFIQTLKNHKFQDRVLYEILKDQY